MCSKWRSYLSALGVPLLGLGSLLFSLSHVSLAETPLTTAGQDLILLQEPNSNLDKTRAILLRQQAKDVSLCRSPLRHEELAKAIDGYNLIARECTPEVFALTHLPVSMTR